MHCIGIIGARYTLTTRMGRAAPTSLRLWLSIFHFSDAVAQSVGAKEAQQLDELQDCGIMMQKLIHLHACVALEPREGLDFENVAMA